MAVKKVNVTLGRQAITAFIRAMGHAYSSL